MSYSLPGNRRLKGFQAVVEKKRRFEVSTISEQEEKPQDQGTINKLCM